MSIKTDQVTHSIVEGKILMALHDQNLAGILASESDLRALISGLDRASPPRGALVELLATAFGGTPEESEKALAASPGDSKAAKGYVFSRDYEALFALISSGAVIAAFVDYKWRGIDAASTTRDICEIIRGGPYDISIGVRGHKYGGLYVFDEESGAEFDLFAARCEAMNLEWIKP